MQDEAQMNVFRHCVCVSVFPAWVKQFNANLINAFCVIVFLIGCHSDRLWAWNKTNALSAAGVFYWLHFLFSLPPEKFSRIQTFCLWVHLHKFWYSRVYDKRHWFNTFNLFFFYVFVFIIVFSKSRFVIICVQYWSLLFYHFISGLTFKVIRFYRRCIIQEEEVCCLQ